MINDTKTPKKKWGTVGAVALDNLGNLAAATSTGGLTHKRSGRVSDSSVIGAGTYADNDGTAVSTTGTGEYFIRVGVAHDINAQVKYKNVDIATAANEVIHKQLEGLGGRGGVIVLNRKGEFTSPYNAKDGLFRAYITKTGETKVILYE